jgi:uncharacterized protein (TIGR02266 family)
MVDFPDNLSLHRARLGLQLRRMVHFGAFYGRILPLGRGVWKDGFSVSPQPKSRSEAGGGGIERREHPRVVSRFAVRFSRASDAAQAFRSYSLNVSSGGLCLRVRREYAVGDPLHLVLEVEAQELMLEGVVAWVRNGTIGVRFTEVDDATRIALSKIVSQGEPLKG